MAAWISAHFSCSSGFAPAAKTQYLDYGFDLQRLGGRRRPEQAFTFGYIGTHKDVRLMVRVAFCQESKGVQQLIEAFSEVLDTMPDARGELSRRAPACGRGLKIFGRTLGQSTAVGASGASPWRDP